MKTSQHKTASVFQYLAAEAVNNGSSNATTRGKLKTEQPNTIATEHHSNFTTKTAKMADGNGSRAAWEEEEPMDLFRWHGTALIFIPLMMMTGFVGNSLVLYITHFRWKKKSIFSFFIKVLAWLDMSNLLLAMPLLLVITISASTPRFMLFCNGTTLVALFTAITSALVLVVIAANRFRKLCHPHSSQVTLPLATKLTVGCFLFGAAVTTPSVWLFGKDTVAYDIAGTPVNISYCFIKKQVNVSVLLLWAVAMGVTFMSVTVTLVTLYGFTIRSLRLHSLRLAAAMRRPSAVSTASKSIFTKHTLVFIAVTVVFFLTYFPYFITVILLLVDRSIESHMGPAAKAFFDLAKLFPLLSNVSNPIIYSFTSERFRGECQKIFRMHPCRKLLHLSRKDSSTQSREMSQSEDT